VSESVVSSEPPVGSPRGGGDGVELQGIHKSFYGQLANEDVDLDLPWGEVHALLGENGAGKSTLCSVLAGLYRPDAGRILIDGVEHHFASPRDALDARIGMVYQHFRLVDTFTVAENVVLSHPETPAWIDRRQMESAVAALCERYGIHVDPAALVMNLSVGERQRVEILKLLHRGVHVLVLDEPTSVLTPAETTALFGAVRSLREEGKTIVFVSHRLEEVLSIADRVTVMRKGRRVGQVVAAETDGDQLVRMMVGEQVSAPVRGSGPASPGPVILGVKGLEVHNDLRQAAVRGLDLEVHAGEIVGIAGVAGNGQRELAEAIAGLRRAVAGSVSLNGQDATSLDVRGRVKSGLAFVPEDRLATGVAGGLPIEDNVIMRRFARAPIARGPFISRRAARKWTDELVERFDIRGVRPGLPMSLLSGGNVQRAILARELAEQPKLLVAAGPTRGLDVGATATIHRLLLSLRDEGAGVLLISEDLDELELLADRIAVIYAGRIMGEQTAGDFDHEAIGRMMAGVEAAA
jgi:simple sugar transport system ATP-binding protein